MSNPILQRLNGNKKATSPAQALFEAKRSGMSPMQFVQQRLQKTPQAQQAMQMLSGDQDQLKATAERLAQQKGIDLNAFVQQASSMF